MRWEDFLWLLHPEPGSLASFDWASGLISVDATRSELARAARRINNDAAPSRREQLLDAALVHEHTHLLQAAACGYLFRWSTQYFALLARLHADIDPGPARFALPQEWFRLVNSQLPDDALDAARVHLALLDRRGPFGVSVRNLFEAHATVTELRATDDALGAGSVFRAMEMHGSSPDDRLALEQATSFLGDERGMALFPPLAAAALCDVDPPQAFAQLLLLANAHRLTGQDAADVDIVLAAMRTRPEFRLIGTAFDELERQDWQGHPVLKGTVEALVRAEFSFENFMRSPHTCVDALASDIVQPLLCRGEADRVADVLLPDGVTEMPYNILLTAAFSGRVAAMIDVEDAP